MNKVMFIILGATGDLAKKKLIPAIYKLVKNKKIKNYAIVGLSRKNISPKDFIKRSNLRNKTIEKQIIKNTYYYNLDFYDKKAYSELAENLNNIGAMHNTKQRIFYLATLPQHFKTISENLSSNKITTKDSKVVFEKPFGDDLKSAKKINKCINKVFSEKQIYRIDHYLGKELIQNISILRFTNEILNPVWNNKHIASVQIILSEDIGVKDRAGFYDKYGVVKDVIQNHALQLLALVAMNEPKSLTSKEIRNKKVQILKNTKIKNYILGQYNAYEIKKSKTPTFAALELEINNSSWKKVPFYIIAGKNLENKNTAIHIEFKNSACKLLKGVCNFAPNHLQIQIQPKEGFHININSKIPGKMQNTQVKMDFCHKCQFGQNTPEAYENLLLDIINGDQSTFIRTDEIEEQWKIVDKVKVKQLFKYKKGSHPKEADKLTKWHLEE